EAAARRAPAGRALHFEPQRPAARLEEVAAEREEIGFDRGDRARRVPLEADAHRLFRRIGRDGGEGVAAAVGPLDRSGLARRRPRRGGRRAAAPEAGAPLVVQRRREQPGAHEGVHPPPAAPDASPPSSCSRTSGSGSNPSSTASSGSGSGAGAGARFFGAPFAGAPAAGEVSGASSMVGARVDQTSAAGSQCSGSGSAIASITISPKAV